MTLKSACLLLAVVTSTSGFTVLPATTKNNNLGLKGYLDDLSNELKGPDANPDVYAESKAATDYDKSQLDRYGPGSFENFVDFDEFDGGDGREYCSS